MKRVPLTGGKGFVGQFLIRRLFESKKISIEIFNQPLESIEQYGEKVECVVHMAGRVSSSRSNSERSVSECDFYRDNVLGTKSVLNFCKIKRAPIIFTSTAAVYGEKPEALPISETTPTAPITIYGSSKLEAENLIEEHVRQEQLSAIVLRIFNVYGPGQRSDFIIPKLIEAAQTDDLEFTLKTPGAVRDFIYVEDVANAIATILENSIEKPIYEVFNLGTGVGTKIIEAKHIVDRLLYRGHCEQPEIENEGKNSVADIAKILIYWPQLNFRNLEQGLALMLNQIPANSADLATNRI